MGAKRGKWSDVLGSDDTLYLAKCQARTYEMMRSSVGKPVHYLQASSRLGMAGPATGQAMAALAKSGLITRLNAGLYILGVEEEAKNPRVLTKESENSIGSDRNYEELKYAHAPKRLWVVVRKSIHNGLHRRKVRAYDHIRLAESYAMEDDIILEYVPSFIAEKMAKRRATTQPKEKSNGKSDQV